MVAVNSVVCVVYGDGAVVNVFSGILGVVISVIVLGAWVVIDVSSVVMSVVVMICDVYSVVLLSSTASVVVNGTFVGVLVCISFVFVDVSVVELRTIYVENSGNAVDSGACIVDPVIGVLKSKHMK